MIKLSDEKRAAIWVIGLVLVFALVFFGGAVFFALTVNYNRHPYRMVIEPAEDGSTVRFIYEDKSESTEKFQTGQHVAERIEIDVRDPDTIIPDGTLEFIDTTLLPGRITIRYGGRHFDVMESRYYVDDVEYRWEAE